MIELNRLIYNSLLFFLVYYNSCRTILIIYIYTLESKGPPGNLF